MDNKIYIDKDIIVDTQLTKQENDVDMNSDNDVDMNSDTEEIDSVRLKEIEDEFFSTVKNNISYDVYKYPTESKYIPIKQTSEIFGPYGTQWIHDIQEHDKITDELEKRGEIYDKLRSVKLPPQRSKEWFKMRMTRITASDGGCVLGQNKYESPYKFILKKTTDVPFQSNKFCYHGKKLEEIATMIYEYRTNVRVEEFGLMAHANILFLGASPDGICCRYKYDGKHYTKYVGRMLEIKCPLTRKIKMSGPIKDHICPIYYWIQQQLQLECCDLEECDFWQCKFTEYSSRSDFIEDTDINEPFRSISFGFEKGCLIQLIPRKTKNKYWSTVYDEAIFIYPPKIEMSPYDCDMWIIKMLHEIKRNPKYWDYVLDRILYWRLDQSKNVTIKRDRKWFSESLPIFKRMWGYVIFFRKNPDKLDLLLDFINTRKIKYNKEIMKFIENLYDTGHKKYDKFIKDARKNIKKIKKKKTKPKIKYDSLSYNDGEYMFIDDE